MYLYGRESRDQVSQYVAHRQERSKVDSAVLCGLLTPMACQDMAKKACASTVDLRMKIGRGDIGQKGHGKKSWGRIT